MKFLGLSLGDVSLLLGIIATVLGIIATVLGSIGWMGKKALNFLKAKLVDPLQDALAKLSDSVDRLEATSQSEHKLLHDAIDEMDKHLDEHDEHFVKHDEQIKTLFDRRNFRK